MSDPLTKHTLFLREGDMTILREKFPSTGGSVIIRKLVARFVDDLNRPVTDKQVQKLLAEEEAAQKEHAR